MDKRHLMLKVDTDTLEEFEALTVQAKEIGASHVFVSNLPRSRWQWERDLNDPTPTGAWRSSIYSSCMCRSRCGISCPWRGGAQPVHPENPV
jgi:hypothetical protein